MSNILNKAIVLALNTYWQPIGHTTVEKAIGSMCPMSDTDRPTLALDIEYIKVNGEWDFEHPANMRTVSFEEWLELPVREFDIPLHTAKITFRCPLVIMSQITDKMPMFEPKYSKFGIKERDKVCAYTLKALAHNEGNIDHVIPRGQGGSSSWDNCVYSSREVNSFKDNRTPEQAGLQLRLKPRVPLPRPRSALYRSKPARHPAWLPFTK